MVQGIPVRTMSMVAEPGWTMGILTVTVQPS